MLKIFTICQRLIFVVSIMHIFASGFIQDRHATGKTTPLLDYTQDIELVDGREINGVTSITFRRQLTNCDINDRDIIVSTCNCHSGQNICMLGNWLQKSAIFGSCGWTLITPMSSKSMWLCWWPLSLWPYFLIIEKFIPLHYDIYSTEPD